MYHFTGVQGAAAIKGADIGAGAPTPPGATTDIGGGGGCFVDTTGHGLTGGFSLALPVGLIAAACVALARMKTPE